MLKRGKVYWRYDSPNILDYEDCLGRDSIGGEVFVDGRSEICAIDEEFEGYWLLCL